MPIYITETYVLQKYCTLSWQC